jgi:hypothetical protein
MSNGSTADLVISGFSLWMTGRAHPRATDRWDADWINIRAVAEAKGAHVELSGSWLRSSELATFAEELAKMHKTLQGVAHLNCIEPMLDVKLRFVDSVGHIKAVVQITPDHLTQSHQFEFEVDQSHLGPVVEQCRQVLKAFPVPTPSQFPSGPSPHRGG